MVIGYRNHRDTHRFPKSIKEVEEDMVEVSLNLSFLQNPTQTLVRAMEAIMEGITEVAIVEEVIMEETAQIETTTSSLSLPESAITLGVLLVVQMMHMREATRTVWAHIATETGMALGLAPTISMTLPDPQAVDEFDAGIQRNHAKKDQLDLW
ncbi:hypothetical protein OEA41_009296 [Lepraria neglecta]|uniref:Uncharacterized protein n=1 Tax=Lepraria neglecta TaxID=209136 RepID=A0AAD9Z4M0_9LECA|nr:hypothetical protein OEA41_009296 [Lepraria neglecta]